MSSTVRRVVIWATAIAVFAVIVILAIAAVLSQSGRSDGRSGMEEAPSAAPSPSVSGGVPNAESNSPEVPAASVRDCGVEMTADEYEFFTQRLMEYEAIRLSYSPDRLELMTPYATEYFLRTQTDVGSDPVITVSISLENSSTYGCFLENSTTITAYVNPRVTIQDLNTGDIQQQHQPLPIHYTEWIKIDDSWFVNQERF